MQSELACAGLPGRILVVEDDRQILAIISLLLEDEGYEITTAGDGGQALARLREGLGPDLIILDLMMPNLDGWEFRAIQREDPSLATIPVLAISADSSAKAKVIDAASFMPKPFGAEDLLARVEKLLRERVRSQARSVETGHLVHLGRLAAEATHEINNRLCAVSAKVSTLERLSRGLDAFVGELPARQLDPALTARGQATATDLRGAVRDLRAGTDGVGDVLDDLRRRMGRRDQPFTAVDLRAVLETAVALSQHELRPRARLVTRIPPGALLVRGNEVRLGQLFTNLLINAAQAIPRGGADGHEVAVVVDAGAQALTVEVHDTGAGLALEAQARLFEPFFTTKSEGTGLGLAICQAIVREHLGTIAVESTAGAGTIFRVTLPAEAPQPAPAIPARRRPEPMRVGPAPGRAVVPLPGPRR